MSTTSVFREIRFRIYPSGAQLARLLAWDSCLRFLWNLAHEQYRMGSARSRGERVFPTAFDQIGELTELRAHHEWIRDAPRTAQDAVLMRLHEAWRSCWRKRTPEPSFKKRGRAMVSVQMKGTEIRWLGNGAVRLGKLGTCQALAHRELCGKTKRVTIRCDAGQWFALFLQEIPCSETTRRIGSVGIDRGVVALVADSDGMSIPGPRFLERSARKLARAQRALSRAKKGSKNREKSRLRLARAHRKVRRQRAWLQHQISHDYANSHGVVVIEKLETARMTRSARGTVDSPGRNVRQKAGLNRSILDAGWSGLAEKLRYKLGERGGELVEVPAAYSSQTCSACGVVDAASRRTQAAFCCTACGHAENADTNAARVILSRWSPPVQPVEACDGAA